MDFSFFAPIPSTNQIFGHTRDDDVRLKTGERSINLCLDCGNASVAAIVQGNHVEILRMSGAPIIC
jgi:hypothetical protein